MGALPPPSSRSFGERVRENLERLLGQRGSPLDGAVTFRDLIQIGVVTSRGPSGVAVAPGEAGAVSPGAGLVTNEPAYSAVPPPAPVDVSISVAYLSAIIQWAVPAYGNHSYAEIWRASTDDLSVATLHAQVPGQPRGIFTASVQFTEEWFYWVRLVSQSGIPGPWHSTSGLNAQGPVSVAEVLADLGETIDLGYLGTDVTNSLDLIPGLQDQINTLQSTTAAEVFVQDAKPLPGVGGTPDPIPQSARWYDSNDNNAPYLWSFDSLRDANIGWFPVTGTGHFQAEHPSGGSPPGISEPDAVVQFDGTNETTLTRVADNTTALSAGEWSWQTSGPFAPTIIIRLSDDSDPDLLATNYLRGYSWMSLLDPRTGQNESAITALDSRLTTAEGDITSTSSALSVLDTTVTNLDGVVTSQSSSITSLESRVTVAEGTIAGHTTSIDANATAVSSLDTRVTSAEGTITSQASSITALESGLTAAEANILAQGTAISSLETTTTQLGDDISVQSSRIDIVESNITSGNLAAPDIESYATASAASKWYDGVGSSGPLAEVVVTIPGSSLTRAIELVKRDGYHPNTFRVAAGEVISISGWIDTSSALHTCQVGLRVTDEAGGGQNWLGAFSVPAGQGWQWIEGTITIPAGKALAQGWIQQNTFNNPVPACRFADIRIARTAAASAVEFLETRVDAVEGDIVNVEARHGVRLDVNGYVTGFIQNNDGQQGDFVVLADKFIVRRPDGGGSPIVPFAVVNGVVYIDAARIRDGTITSAKIGSLSADKITTGTMSANRIFGGTINGNNVSVTNLSAASITTGALSASRINLDGLTLENNGGQLRIKNGGVDTGQLVDNAVSRLEQSPAATVAETDGGGTWQDIATVTASSTGKRTRVHASGLLTRKSGGGATYCWVRVTRDGADISGTTSYAIWLPGGATFHTPWAVSIPQDPTSGSHTYKIQVKDFPGIIIRMIRPSLLVDEFKK